MPREKATRRTSTEPLRTLSRVDFVAGQNAFKQGDVVDVADTSAWTEALWEFNRRLAEDP
jgi:hypothetical protein